jgi:hypothetical protein
MTNKKNIIWLIVFPLISVALLLFIEGYRFYIIILSIVILVYSITFISDDYKRFLKKTWYIFCLILIAFLWGVFKRDTKFWSNFEESSIILTLLYSIFIYIRLLLDKTVNKQDVLIALPALLGALLLISLSVWAQVGGGLDLKSRNGFGITIESKRNITMGLLTIGTGFYLLVNFILTRNESTYKEVYIKSIQYSDVPVAITFLLLWASTFALNDISNEIFFDSFYGGVIAFQMIYSNIVWSFIDDPIIEKLFKNKK